MSERTPLHLDHYPPSFSPLRHEWSRPAVMWVRVCGRTSGGHVRAEQDARVLPAELEEGGGALLLLLPAVDVEHRQVDVVEQLAVELDRVTRREEHLTTSPNTHTHRHQHRTKQDCQGPGGRRHAGVVVVP